MRKLFVSIVFICMSSIIQAEEQSGKIIDINVTSKLLSTHHTHIRLSGIYNSANAAACSTDPTKNNWAINTDTAHGKSLLSAILLAQSANKTVTFLGSGACHPDEAGPNGMANLRQVRFQ